jgi:hypothetical protein
MSVWPFGPSKSFNSRTAGRILIKRVMDITLFEISRTPPLYEIVYVAHLINKEVRSTQLGIQVIKRI